MSWSWIGLRVVGDMPERFARVVVANGRLPVVPEGLQLIQLPDPPLLDPDIRPPFDDAVTCTLPGLGCFQQWATFALTSPNFRNTLGEAPTNIGARLVFNEFEKPSLTLFGRLDPRTSASRLSRREPLHPGGQGPGSRPPGRGVHEGHPAPRSETGRNARPVAPRPAGPSLC